ncbi:3'-5' exoribonuclease [Alkalihalobacillus alcalophilus ATCC 27647 = CGMCC 1.3604]|uniref:3'-5' exoribonuclease YhaM n=1 Tax=Alkalihalobacillus alcalophilus ATCC 27647 = CGMCC 1.3604 TaxID=1218173 RepID=A0A094XGZ2_ALKAL|nr:3'-5' exoribonuclease YhaM [Alkalihalobacillus alcalophilus]KGA98060.1 3'-5' exonuclease [Alkalihalobacillus alcalophilus ATCC 27647 = CGMCC 1.3604]MED1561057.1 3'-5' exoribonuclease YhaM [Alkalihalobacillus alcalophilus]THG88321.1 3'-5' exoribonuclease [Alkalihalobacillus alcalophilus ATCC 27647 = CGMCC 1.3604]
MSKGIRYHQVGDKIDSYFLIKTATRGIASNGKPFLTLILGDHSGEIDAKLWGCSPDDEATFVSKSIVHLTGELGEYRGRNQLKLQSIRPTTAMDNVKLADFVRSAPLSPEDMLEQVTQYIFEMKNPNIQRITRHLLKKHQAAFLESPAATKNHHEFFSGLAYHVVSMLHISKSLSQLYPSLDTDLLYAGIILHDLGKVRELSGPIDTVYTLEGNLLGHITIMVNEIDEAAKELNIEGEEVLILQHMVLSHHGKGEWGSPKAPQIKEAELLHLIDNIDAKMNMLDRALERVQPGGFSERVMALDNRSFYKPSFHEPPLDL